MDGCVERKISHSHFSRQRFATKHGKAFISFCEATLSSELFSLHFRAKRCTGNETDCDRVSRWKSHHRHVVMTYCRCLNQLSWTDCNWTQTQNYLVHKRTLNHLAKHVRDMARTYSQLSLTTEINIIYDGYYYSDIDL